MKLPPAGAVHDEREIEAVGAVTRHNPTMNIAESPLHSFSEQVKRLS